MKRNVLCLSVAALLVCSACTSSVDDVKGVISQYDDSLNAATSVVAMQRVSMECADSVRNRMNAIGMDKFTAKDKVQIDSMVRSFQNRCNEQTAKVAFANMNQLIDNYSQATDKAASISTLVDIMSAMNTEYQTCLHAMENDTMTTVQKQQLDAINKKHNELYHKIIEKMNQNSKDISSKGMEAIKQAFGE